MSKLTSLVITVLLSGCADTDDSLPVLRELPEEVPIPAGTFMMGNRDGPSSEQPPHEVTVAAFFMDTTEVTVAAYQRCVDAGVCSPGTSYLDGGIYCNTGRSDRDDHPINCVFQADANAYCAWVGKRLPTEEEWEYAARGPENRIYPWGWSRVTDEACWSGHDTRQRSTCRVGSFPKDESPFGVMDMAGNVTERTSSFYTTDYESEPANPYPVTRGGCFNTTYSFSLRTTRRSPEVMDLDISTLGFRCAR